MFNSMELMGNYVGGASLPLLRKSTSFLTKGKIGKGPLTAKDRQRISNVGQDKELKCEGMQIDLQSY